MPPGPERRQAWAELSHETAAEPGAVAHLRHRNNLNLVSENYGGYYYGPGKTIYLGLAYVNQ